VRIQPQQAVKDPKGASLNNLFHNDSSPESALSASSNPHPRESFPSTAFYFDLP